MASSNQAVLCRYRYDPLDRLASSSPVGQANLQRFYQKNRLATEIQGTMRRTVFQHDDLLLAQQRRVEGVLETTLLATDQQRSVLQLVDKAGTEPIAYSPYGHHPAESGLTSLLGFNGERRDPVTGHYLLGNGYRAYNPVLMRFNSPDSLSPFGEGGLNAYGYVGGDPVGFGDETGHGKFGVIGMLAARTANRNRPSVIKGPLRMKGSSKLVASVPSSIEYSYAHTLPPSTGIRPSSAEPGSVGWPGGKMTAASTSSATTANASVSTLALLSDKDVKKYFSLLNSGLGSDLPYTETLILAKQSHLENRILAAERMVDHYRLKSSAVDGKYIATRKKALGNYMQHLVRENNDYIDFKNKLERVRRNNS
ncbi:RHS repeat-associated core domain-containing protein [Pseudomonas syringae group genomosp. 3]|uniref:RHS repeat-associated core domain-containing protein n=3 Tax=Pseudomonas syringae group genomosp. 3 TaxID=251701 RepID=UPI002180442C|nr:RHS repeat-associated core domain-containing protein [Pseudomonas syringae group genomosp. 3]